tara:strand:+ start:794 stop:1030 length:237 start_codon:yes stop_codon:yes gene_type:complete
MPTIQVYNVKFDTTDDGFGDLSLEETLKLEREIEGHIFEVDADPEHFVEFEYEICEEISSETGWLVNSFDYRLITIGN